MIVISGAMVASLALPASAATPPGAPVALAVAVVPPTAAQAPLVPRTFGAIGFTGIVKPVVKPRPVVVVPVAPVAPVALVVPVRAVVQVSRSNTRAAISPTPVRKQRTTNAAPVARSGSILDIAASLNGIYYIYGGTTTAGFDCSGFTQYVFGKAGISLPRVAEAQRQAATPVTNPQPGDLVFFGAPAHHVGIYAGNNTMWDSPHTGATVSHRAIYTTAVTYGRP